MSIILGLKRLRMPWLRPDTLLPLVRWSNQVLPSLRIHFRSKAETRRNCGLPPSLPPGRTVSRCPMRPGGFVRVAIYGRVSTAEQSAAMQVDELRAYCQRRQWDVVEEFIDAGVSGAKERRPALDRLLAEAKRRKFDAVLVYRYDRFARSLRQLVQNAGQSLTSDPLSAFTRA